MITDKTGFERAAMIQPEVMAPLLFFGSSPGLPAM